ncbi:MAG: trigger factor [Gemmataceae bacterium]|nr:trigger factor [Gemmataceae bacterium]MDW8266819.1 trigger factor [Gemmataceae bacterium]
MTEETNHPTTEASTVAEVPPADQGADERAGDDLTPTTAETKKKLRQTVEMRDVGPCRKHIKVTVSRDDIDERMSEKFKELVLGAETPIVPGFRPGKAPRKIIERRYRKDVTEQVRGEIMLASLEQVAEDQKLTPLSPPDLDPSKIEIPEEGPLVYEFEVEVMPEFELPNYKGLKLPAPVREFTEEEINREEKRLLRRYGQVVPKPDDRAYVELGDRIVANMTTYFNGQQVSQSERATFDVHPALAFKDGVAERFGEALQGARVGESRTVEIVLSDAVANPSMRGQKVEARLEIQDIKAVQVPEPTPEILKDLGVRNRELLRELLRVVLERRMRYLQRQEARRQLMQQVASAAEWDLPRDLLIRQARVAFYRRIMEMRAAGMSEQEITAQQRLLERDVIEHTARSLREHFVLQKIAEQEKIEVSDDDIEEEIERIAARNDESPRRVRARLEREDMLDALAAEILERKTLDFILEHAQFEDVPLAQLHEGRVGTVEEQAVPGELQDPTAQPPAEAEPQDSSSPPAS